MTQDENSKAAAADRSRGNVHPLFPQTNTQATKPKHEPCEARPQVTEDDDDPGPTAA